jgi:hypothetical protein
MTWPLAWQAGDKTQGTSASMSAPERAAFGGEED